MGSTMLVSCWPLLRMLKTNIQLTECRVWEESWMRKARYDVKSENMLFSTVITGEMSKGVSVNGGEGMGMLQCEMLQCEMLHCEMLQCEMLQ